MDIDRTNFPHTLPTILKRIADSHFIAIDLELSGIPDRNHRRLQNKNGKANLEERYAEIKDAAEKYHILQVGLTCVQLDTDNERYAVRPFNFSLSPLVPEDMGIEREFTYSSGAVDFLLSHGYKMETPFERGLPYLTRQETTRVEELARMRSDRSSIPDIVIAENDTKARDFVERVRREVREWRTTKKPEANWYNVFGKAVSNDSSTDSPLNRFEKRLVHQIVRADFPELSTYSRPDCVSVQWKDQEEEMHMQNQLQLRLTGEINRQVGFRWVAEALVGGDLSNAYLAMNTRHIDGEVTPNSSKGFTRRLAELDEKSRTRPKVFVGHNCFMDFVYLYKLFFGDLPDRVEDFQAAMVDAFPHVFDTKYMSTAGSDSRFRGAQLWQLEEALADHDTPEIYMPRDQQQYYTSEKYHEAGFDSFVTAKVFLRLASRLKTMTESGDTTLIRNRKVEKPGQAPRPTDSGLDEDKKPLNTLTNTGVTAAEKPVDPDWSTAPAYDENEKGLQTPTETVVTTKSKKHRKSKTAATNGEAKGPFAHANRFESLLGMPHDSDVRETQKATAASTATAENPASSANTLKPKADASVQDAQEQLIEDTQNLSLTKEPEQRRTEDKRMLPGWEEAFWQDYRNKLRVFGTVEEVCEFGPRKKVDAQEQAGEQEEDDKAKSGRRSSWAEWAKRLFT